MNAAGAKLAQESATLNALLSQFKVGNAVQDLRTTAGRMGAPATPAAAARATVPLPTASAKPRPAVRASAGGAALAQAPSDDWQEF